MLFNGNVESCTRDASTCSITQEMVTRSEFYEVVPPVDREDQVMCKVLGDMVTMCALATCPGRNPDKALRIIHNILDSRPTTD